MSLQKWFEYGWLRPYKTSRKEISDLLRITDRDLLDATGDNNFLRKMNPKTGLYKQLINVVLGRRLRALPVGAFEVHHPLQNILDISKPIAICKTAHPPSLCFFGNTLNFGGFFLYDRTK